MAIYAIQRAMAAIVVVPSRHCRIYVADVQMSTEKLAKCAESLPLSVKKHEESDSAIKSRYLVDKIVECRPNHFAALRV